MPTYEYACRDCGRHLEVVQSFTDDPLQTCERCGGKLRKVFSAAGIIFKGSGYYVTDTRGERTRAAANDGASSDGATSDASSKRSSDAGANGSSADGKRATPPATDAKSA